MADVPPIDPNALPPPQPPQPQQPGLLDILGNVPGVGAGSYVPNWNNGGQSQWISDNAPRTDDAAMVAHNMQLAMASRGANPATTDFGAQQIQMGTPPSYTSGSTYGGSPSVFDPRNGPSLNGNWFNMNAYNQQGPPGTSRGTGAANMPSTNDWRLLPPQYRDPNYYAYNGTIIDRRLAQYQLSPKSIMGEEFSAIDPGYHVYPGANEPGTWTWTNRGMMGVPGQLTPWSNLSPGSD